MAEPTQPTATTIITEAYRRWANITPTAGQITTATSEAIEKVKRDIWIKGKKWRSLITTRFDITRAGVSRVSNPTDFETSYDMTLFDGPSRSTLQTAATGTATLASSESIVQGDAEGAMLIITSGTGVNQGRQIDDYNASTKVATMAQNWTTTPAAGDGYLIGLYSYEVNKRDIQTRDRYRLQGLKDRPLEYFPLGSGSEGYYELSPTPDKVYGIMRRYYANLLRVDLSASIYNVILRNWAGILTQGVYVWLLSGESDRRYREQEAIYQAMLRELAARELEFHSDNSNLQARITD